ncbi:MAG: succinate dehydrogenase hydrophobic membrane anchor subunit [Actinomycetales bacterium]|nr:succinate dehydrogenase hydrophobic membrane anchor subunit [Actinomycetales bacterium]
MSAPDIEAPRTRSRIRATRTDVELCSWLFMRMSGVVLVALITLHLVMNLVVGDGIQGVDFAFVAGKWADPFWQVVDLTMLWLAMIHGTNGVRTVINDHARRDLTRYWLKMLLYLSFTVVVVLGTLVVLTFDPCPVGADAALLPDFCPAR